MNLLNIELRCYLCDKWYSVHGIGNKIQGNYICIICGDRIVQLLKYMKENKESLI